jgi:hypothetical protein
MKRKKCLICKEPMALWLYGMPIYENLSDKIKNKEIVLGGCCISNNDPKWACIQCCFSYREDGIGYLDKGLIESQEDNYFFSTILEENGTNEEEMPPYQLPEKIKHLLSDDFLQNETTKRSIGAHFHEGGYDTSHKDIRYLDGILVWNCFKNLMERLELEGFKRSLPAYVFVLPNSIKKRFDKFITTSTWKRKYVNLSIMDGIQWEMKRLVQKNILTSFGSNEFPKVYENWMSYLEEIKVACNRDGIE